LDELIEAELVRQAAAKHGIEVTAGELEQELAAAVKERGGPEKFEVSLGKEGHTREQFMERVKTTLQRKKLRELLVPFEVTDEEVRRYYDTRYVKRTVRPGQKEPDPVKPFEEVKESIRRTIKARKVQEGTRTLIERLQAEFPVKRYQ
jgi:hypothetical protein